MAGDKVTEGSNVYSWSFERVNLIKLKGVMRQIDSEKEFKQPNVNDAQKVDVSKAIMSHLRQKATMVNIQLSL